MSEAKLISPFHFYQVRGHAVERCDATTGHSVWPIAYCDTPERAKEVYKAIDVHDALVAALSRALDDFRSLSKSAGTKAARLHGQEAYQRVREVLTLVNGEVKESK